MNKHNAAKQLGKLGGMKTFKNHGIQHFSEIGKKGAIAKKNKKLLIQSEQ